MIDMDGALNAKKEGGKDEAKNKESLDLKSGPENELTNTDFSKKRVQRANEAKAPAMETKTIKTPPLTLHQEEIIPSVAGPSACTDLSGEPLYCEPITDKQRE